MSNIVCLQVMEPLLECLCETALHLRPVKFQLQVCLERGRSRAEVAAALGYHSSSPVLPNFPALMLAVPTECAQHPAVGVLSGRLP